MNASSTFSSRTILLFFGLSLVLGAGLQAFYGLGSFWIGWLAGSGLFFAGALLLRAAWRWSGGSRALAWMMALAFLLRLGLGVGLNAALPVWGYPEKEQQAGYIFPDAYMRDQQAWGLARSGDPLWVAFTDQFSSDQYGGLLAMSALVYRGLSPDAHRAYLLLILAALAATAGLPFLWKAASQRWGAGVATIAGWIYALYPESVILGSSQMREPFLIPLTAVAFWALLALPEKRKTALAVLAASLLGLALISTLVAVSVAAVLAVWFLLDRGPRRRTSGRMVALWIFLGVVAMTTIALSWRWFNTVAIFDAGLTEKSSGWVIKVLRYLPSPALNFPFLIAYGITRPVLPAALLDNGAWLWRGLWIWRSLGWYALAPLLVYGLFTVWRAPQPRERRTLVWMMILIWAWIIISSARGGGDGNDNPRYRTIFIVWMALASGWAWEWARVHQDRWLGRWLAVEAVFLVFFTQWYLSRYLKWGGRMPFFTMVGLIAGINGAILIGGWLWDRWQQQRQQSTARRSLH